MSNLLLGRSQFGDPANMGNVLTKNDAEDLLNGWVINDRLKLHMRQVAYLMHSWAAEKEESR